MGNIVPERVVFIVIDLLVMIVFMAKSQIILKC